MGKINDSIKKEVYKLMRQSYLKRMTSNIGEIVENEDEIVCYVNQKSIDALKNNIYHLNLGGIRCVDKEFIDFYKLNKNVHYIFENINFDGFLILDTWGADATFKNCSFDKGINIGMGNNIVFENNKYVDNCNVYFGSKQCFFGASFFDKITFINDNIFNSCNSKYSGNSAPIFGIDITFGNVVEFIDSNVNLCDEYPASMTLNVEKVRIKNSVINAKEISVDSKNIECKDSSINAQDGAIIENKDCDFNGNIQAPFVFYNGNAFECKNGFVVDKDSASLKDTRQRLVDNLARLINYCQQLNDNRVQEVKDELNNQAIAKTLKLK